MIERLTSEQLNKTWTAYKETSDQDARSRLILHYQPLVRFLSKRVGSRLPAHIDNDDLISYGIFGLMEAIDKFDLARGIKFETFASLRIRGAIIDELRSIDWIPRSVRSLVRETDHVVAELETALNRPPTDAEVADHMGVPLEEYQRSKGQQSQLHIAALDALLTPDGGGESDNYSLNNQLRDVRVGLPDMAYEVEEMKHAVARSLAVLDEREAIVLVLYYYEGLTLAEIGDQLNVTESRVSQMHTRAIVQVRARLAVA